MILSVSFKILPNILKNKNKRIGFEPSSRSQYFKIFLNYVYNNI